MLAPNSLYINNPTIRACVNGQEGVISLPDANGFRLFTSDTGSVFTVGAVSVVPFRGRTGARSVDVITDGGDYESE
jgi:hypothetical protein